MARIGVRMICSWSEPETELHSGPGVHYAAPLSDTATSSDWWTTYGISAGTREFFPSLLVCQKWHIEWRDSRVGDIVLLQHRNIARSNWRLSKGTAMYPGREGKVCTVGA